MIKNKMIQYLLFYLAFAAVTVFCMFEFWPSSMRPSSFGYVVFFICFLEALVFLFPGLVKSENTKGKKSYLVLLSSFITIYIIVSLILLVLGVFLSPASSTLIYILTIGFTVLFAFLIFIYWNLTESEDAVDIDDDKNRIAKKKINNEFNKMLIKFQDSQEHITGDNLNKINTNKFFYTRRLRIIKPSLSKTILKYLLELSTKPKNSFSKARSFKHLPLSQ